MRRSAICVTLPFMRLMLVTALLLSASASADLRCDTDLVSRGMTSFEVLERCGAPVYETAFVDVRHPGVFVYVDEWLYDLGSNRFRRLLTFENGRLARIETRPKPRPQPTAARALRNSLSQGPSSRHEGSRQEF
jgi:hypothetical protein